MTPRALTTRRPAVARRLVALWLVLAMGALGGCGVSSSGAPVKIGDALSVGGGLGGDPVKQPEGPIVGGRPDQLVRLYLKAAAGGDASAPGRLREFLSDNAKKAWRDPAPGQSQTLPLTVIRILDDPTIGAQVLDRTPVTVTYQVVGILGDLGQVTAPPGDPAAVRTMKFWMVLKGDASLLIDQIEFTGDPPPGLMISDDTLTEFYRPQPIYFWDATNTHLIPDLRYLPLTLGRDQRAQKVVQWLLDAPSPWLLGTPFAQRLPSGMSIKDGVTKTASGAWVINLAAPNGLGGDDAVRRLYYQLQWSLRLGNTPSIDLEIEGQPQHIAAPGDDYLRFNLYYDLTQVRVQNFDIVDGRVVAVPQNSTAQPAVLKSKDNANVVYAAVDRSAATLALVRTDSANKRYLQIVRDADGTHVDAKLPHRTDMGRPVWLPGTDLILVVSGGLLYAVQSSGEVTDITPAHKTGVTSVSVAPDGRRIAWVAGGDAFVAPLMADGVKVDIGASPMPLLADELQATGIVWTSEAWLYVVGTSGGAGAMWQTTLDGAVARNVDLKGAKPTDLVALASGTTQAAGQVLLYTEQGRYTFGTLLSGDNSLKNPFFVS